MGKKKTARGALLAANLPQLQNLIKRDPEGYREEFLQQLNHFESIRRIFELKPEDEDDAKRFRELIGFLSQVTPCYPKDAANFPKQLSVLLVQNYASLSQDIRVALVHNLVLLRNKSAITSLELLQTLFPILPRTTSSSLRSFIRNTILTDIRVANTKSKNHKLNRAIQAILFTMVERGMDAEVQGDKGTIRGQKPSDATKTSTNDEAIWAVALTKQLWKKGVWDDAKTVSIIALACFHPHVKVQNAAIHFFLGEDDEDEEDDEDNDSQQEIRSLQLKRAITKTTTSGDKKIAKAVKALKKKSANKRAQKQAVVNFPALQLLHDPQTFGEKLYESLSRYDKRFSLDHKILYMQLVSRVMGAHKLCILGFYSYIIRFLTYHQLRVTIILVSLAQSVHDLTPPDVLVPVINKLAKEFVHPGVGPEVIAAGINAIREVCRRQPWCMEEDLLSDLIEYRKSNDKGVVTAARGLLQLYREVNPELLKRRERGKAASMGLNTATLMPFGHSANLPQTIDGLDLLKAFLDEQKQENGDEEIEEDDEAGWDGWDVESESGSSDSGSWIDVDSDGPEVSVSDSDDDEPRAATSTQPAAAGVQPQTPVDSVSVMELATNKILTPADFALINDLRLEAAKRASETTGSTAAKRKISQLEANKRAAEDPNVFLSEMDILGPRKKAKADYAERMESIQKGREGREKFGSSKGKQKSTVGSSTTNREKARQKPLMMILASGSVRGKKKASLRDKQKKLRAHIERAKKAGH
ncbi:actin cytoskeleton organization and cell cycle progression protein [Clavulina sp. PMI_390]|nr:actin cytoskeleton organization and cell cycle progression protein [Clavulina sp. PMI_390]